MQISQTSRTTASEWRYISALKNEVNEILKNSGFVDKTWDSLNTDVQVAVEEFLTDINFAIDPLQDKQRAKIIARGIIDPNKADGQISTNTINTLVEALCSTEIRRGLLIQLKRATHDTSHALPSR